MIKASPASLLVGWNMDVGKLGIRVIEYLSMKLKAEASAKIGPTPFFSFAGVSVEGSTIQFPECILYFCGKGNLILFRGDPPEREWYSFLNTLIDKALAWADIRELYTLGGMAGMIPHTLPRRIQAVFSSSAEKERLAGYNLGEKELNYQTPAGQRPTMNSYLLWLARERHIEGVNLWVPIPFYLSSVGDSSAQRVILEFFNQRFNLGIGLEEIHLEASRQDEKIALARKHSLEIDNYLRKLEQDLSLSEDEHLDLLKRIEDIFCS